MIKPMPKENSDGQVKIIKMIINGIGVKLLMRKKKRPKFFICMKVNFLKPNCLKVRCIPNNLNFTENHMYGGSNIGDATLSCSLGTGS